MSAPTDKLLTQLHGVLAELEGLIQAAAGTVSDEASEAATRLKQGARSAEDYVHKHTWFTLGVAAVVGFLIGALTARHE